MIDMHAHKDLITRLLGAITGLVYITLCYELPQLINLELNHHIELAFLVLAPIALLLSAHSQQNRWAITLIILLGVLAGIMINVFLDKGARNHFPIEMGARCVMLAPAIILGTAIGVWLRKLRKSKTTGRSTPECAT